jgi:hypothetical protein
MQPAVRNAWRQFNESLEGLTSWMYLDIKGLVTTGMGNLIDPVSVALQVRWFHGDGTPASPDDVRAEWTRIKNHTALAQQGAQAAKAVATLHLEDAAIDTLILGRLDQNERILKANAAFQALDDWPADAQLGLFSMAWAMGPSFGADFPHFCRACAARDFAAAAAQCKMDDTQNAGLGRRNTATQQAFSLAANAADPTVLQSRVPPQ